MLCALLCALSESSQLAFNRYRWSDPDEQKESVFLQMEIAGLQVVGLE